MLFSIVLLLSLSLYSMVGLLFSPEQVKRERFLDYRFTDINITQGLLHTYNLSIPFITDAILYDDMGWKLLVTLSATHLPQKEERFKGSFLLHYDGMDYEGERKPHEYSLLIMKYHLPNIAIINGSIRFSIRNNETNLFYPNCMARVLPRHVKQGVATCSMATNYDTFYDIANFISYNLFAGVDTVILYVSSRFSYIPVLHFLFGKRLKVFLFWPIRNIGYGHYDVLIAQLNSCYYRNRDQFKYLIMIDLDEMLFNHTNETLYDLIDSQFTSPSYCSIQVILSLSLNYRLRMTAIIRLMMLLFTEMR